MDNSATQMLVSATIEFLRDHPPFDRMETDDIVYLCERVKLDYFPKDTEILSTASGIARTFYILQRGKVIARQTGDVSLVEYSSVTLGYSSVTLGPGECFPICSVMAQRPSTNSYVAIDDVFCYALPTEDFFVLMQRSPVFNLFCTQYIASLLSQSRHRLDDHR